MGNCCPGGESDAEQQPRTNTGGRKPQAFQGEGNRLGTADESRYKDVAPTAMKRGDDIPEPVLDKNLTDEDRAKIRADRAAAAEARVKKQGGKVNKKKATTSAPLTGPNSAPLMRWN